MKARAVENATPKASPRRRYAPPGGRGTRPAARFNTASRERLTGYGPYGVADTGASR